MELNYRKIKLTKKKPIFVKNRKASKEIEMVTESIPQLILQIYIFQKKNNISNVFSYSQLGSIITSIFSILFGLIGINGYKAFYYYEQKRILFRDIRYQEKELVQKIGRFISLFFWYFSVVFSRVLLIVLMLSYKKDLIIPLILLTLFKSSILSTLEKNYFKQKKYIPEFKNETKLCTPLSEEIYGQNIIERFIHYKPKSKLKSILTFVYTIMGLYDNIFINIENHSDHFYIPRQTNNYIIFYFLFYIENIIFAFILYYEFNIILRIILFCAFPISVLIQIIYRRKNIKEVGFYSCLNKTKSKYCFILRILIQ